MEEPFQEFGEKGFTAMVAAFYRRIRDDDVVGRMYPQNPTTLRHAEEGLCKFLVERFDGQGTEWRGAPLGVRHSYMRIGKRERDRWLELMSAAMDEVGLEGPARERLDFYFTDTADSLVNQYESPREPAPYSPSLGQRPMPFEEVADEEL